MTTHAANLHANEASAVLQDAAERAKVLDVTGSFVVQAPAGSGKTGLLVLRFLALLARVERPEAVLAITFTRKAAGEMRHRIVTALVDAASATEPPADPYERERYDYARAVLARDEELRWGLLHSPSRLQVFTIDGFCSRIVAGTPLLSRLGSTPSVVDDAEPLYREAVRRALSPSGRAMLGERLEVLLERYEMGIDKLETQLLAMLARRDQWREGTVGSSRDEQAWVAKIEASFAQEIAAEVESFASDVEPGLVARIHEVARRSRTVNGGRGDWPTLGDADRLGSRVECASAWKQAARLLAKDEPFRLRTRNSQNSDIHGGDKAVKRELDELLDDLGADGVRWLERLKAAAKLPSSPAFTDDGRAALGAFLAVLRQADAMLWEVFRERRQVDHVEIAMRAVQALGPGETLERLDARLEHILVDEFQDTNVLQCDLLRGLTSGWQDGDGRTLFLVGDPMQSIYRFRKAEVGLFLAARSSEEFLGTCRLTPRTLSVNFRSTRSVVGWVNETFRKLLGNRDDATRSLVAFASAEARPGAEQGIGVEFVLWESDPPRTKADADAVEAAGLADWIAAHLELRRERGWKPRYGEVPVAVLVRGRAHARPLLRALESRTTALRVRAPGLDHLGDRQTAIDLQALTRALLHPGDRLCWLALLRSPWIGLSLGDLSALVEPDVADKGRRARTIPMLMHDAEALSRVSADGRRRIAKLESVASAARRDLATRPLDVAIRAAWLRLGGPSSTTEAMGLEALDAEAFFEILAARSRGGRIDLDELSRAVTEAEAPVDADADVDVEIMTMHKAKGLEFDTVILPALASGTGGSDNLPLAMETEPKSGRLTLVTPRGARGREDADGDKYDFLRFREQRRSRNETLRLLYVAATRTRHCLVLSAAAGRLTKDDTAVKGTLLDALSPALDWSEARREKVDMADKPAPKPLLRFPLPFSLEAAPPSVADRSVVSEQPSQMAERTPEFFAEGKLPAHVGTVYHLFLERIAAEGLDAWPATRVACEKQAVAHALRAEGVLASELDEATERVAAALVATLEDERGRWMLSAGDGARTEWAMTAWRDGRMVSAKLDRSFVADGVRWIVDFKTGRPAGSGAEMERDLDERRRAYAAQLASYRDLVRGTEGGDALPIRLALWFAEWPPGRRWHDVTELCE